MFPDPIEAPDAFGEHLKSLDLHFAQTVFGHYQNRLIQSNGRFDEAPTLEWCERMDTLLGKLNRIGNLLPTNEDVVGSLKTLCSDTVATIKGQLDTQKQSDAAEARKREEEAKARAEEEWVRREEEESQRKLVQIAAAREKLERTTKIADEQMAIIRAERELEAKKQALSEAQKAAGMDVDDADDNEGSDSAPEEHAGTTKKSSRRQKEEGRKRMPQMIHETPCQNCARTNESVCSGPVGQACNMCWRQKRSCTNGGHRRPREITVKEEPKSPGRAAGKKRKVYSTTNANPIGTIEPIDDADTDAAQPVGKRPRTAAASASRVRFDGVSIPKATRKSTRTTKANSKKDANELFARLGQEFAAVMKTCEELAEAFD
ncbi:hypothetical protein PILCRDRAFT_12622 [Piloderma croceum F 1598]|uniref:Uncharacterized protein n=1 Tax=Piloderma croceum (strain F 1598) TaxID=765440 RepID=A0A0C3ARK1_PILCF|nr:hypothetical protein PILCRDRAFT_12622 [Piloderma croceum F 1598]